MNSTFSSRLAQIPVCGYAALWGSQSWLQPAFSRLWLAARARTRMAKPPERRLQAELPAPHRGPGSLLGNSGRFGKLAGGSI
jgi:hypothetical protein